MVVKSKKSYKMHDILCESITVCERKTGTISGISIAKSVWNKYWLSFSKQRCIFSLTIVDHSCPHLAFLLTGLPVMRPTLLVSKRRQTLGTRWPFTHFVLHAGLLTVLPSWTRPGEPQPWTKNMKISILAVGWGLRRGDVRRREGFEAP